MTLLAGFTGVDDPYESPLDCEVSVGHYILIRDVLLYRNTCLNFHVVYFGVIYGIIAFFVVIIVELLFICFNPYIQLAKLHQLLGCFFIFNWKNLAILLLIGMLMSLTVSYRTCWSFKKSTIDLDTLIMICET